MQTLMIFRNRVRFVPLNALQGLPLVGQAVFASTIDALHCENGLFARRYQQGVWAAEETELMPSFVYFDGDDEDYSFDEQVTALWSFLEANHPYCYQIFFSNGPLRAFLSKISDASSGDDQGDPVIGHAILHFVVPKNIFKIHWLDAPEDLAVSGEIQGIASQLYAHLQQWVQTSCDSQKVKDRVRSFCLNVGFSVQQVSCTAITIRSIECMTLDDLSHHPGARDVLSGMAEDLLAVKQSVNAELGVNNKHYLRAARELQICCEPIGKDYYLLSRGAHRALFVPYHRTVQTTEAVARLRNKKQTVQLLKSHGIPFARSKSFKRSELTEDAIQSALSKLKLPVVLKPAQSAGEEVYFHLRTPDDVLSALSELPEKAQHVVLEEEFQGELFRFVVVNHQVKSVLHAQMPVIYGDGKRSIRALINLSNTCRKRKIKITPAVTQYLKTMDLTLQSVLPNGQRLCVLPRRNGDVTCDVTDTMNQRYIELAENISRWVELKVCGLDLMINAAGDYRVFSVCSAPALFPHMEPCQGACRDLFKDILEYVLLNASDDFFDLHQIREHHA